MIRQTRLCVFGRDTTQVTFSYFFPPARWISEHRSLASVHPITAGIDFGRLLQGLVRVALTVPFSFCDSDAPCGGVNAALLTRLLPLPIHPFIHSFIHSFWNDRSLFIWPSQHFGFGQRLCKLSMVLKCLRNFLLCGMRFFLGGGTNYVLWQPPP